MFRIQFIGNLTNDPETRRVREDSSVTNFSVAVNYGFGENQKTEFVRVAAWGKMGESCAKYLAKGRKVLVEGTVTTNAYMGNDGQPRASLECRASSVEFLTPAERTGDAAQAAPAPAPASAASAQFTPVATDDLPF